MANELKLFFLFLFSFQVFSGRSQCYSNYLTTSGGPANDLGHSIVKDSANNCVFVSSLTSNTAGNGWDWVIEKADPDLNTIWSFRYGTQKDETGDNLLVYPDGSGGCIVAGYEHVSQRNMLFMRLDSNGLVLWSKYFNGPASDGETCSDITSSSDGNFIMVGTTNSFGSGASDAFLMKFDPAGTIIWSKSLGLGASQHLYSIEALPGGNFICAGSAAHPGSSFRDCWLLLIDGNGAIIQELILDSSAQDHSFLMDIEVISDNEIYIAGTVSNAGSKQFYCARINSSLSIQWDKTIGGTGVDYGVDVELLSGGSLVLTGYTDAGSNDAIDIVTLNPNDGSLIWAYAFDSVGSDNVSLYGKCMIELDNGQPLVVGWSASFGNSSEYLILAFDPCNMSPCFSQRLWEVQEITLVAIPGNNQSLQFAQFVDYPLQTVQHGIQRTLQCGSICNLLVSIEYSIGCAGDPWHFVAVSNGLSSPSSWSWILDGVVVGSGDELHLPEIDIGSHELVLEVSTNDGSCAASLVELFEVTQNLPELGLPDVGTCSPILDLELIHEGIWTDHLGNAVVEIENSGEYYLEVEHSCGILRDTIDVTFLEPGNVNAVADKTLSCSDQEVAVSLVIADPFIEVQWSYSDLFDPGVVNDVELSVNDPGYYVYSVSFANGCTLRDSIAVAGVFELFPDLVFMPSIDCGITPSEISVQNLPSDAALEWSTTNGTILSGIADESIEIGSSGTYTLQASLGQYCFAQASIDVVISEPEYNQTDLLPDTITCYSPVAEIEFGGAQDGLSYQWLMNENVITGAEGDSLLTDVAGLYGIIITDLLTGCDDTLWTAVGMDVVIPEISLVVTDSLSCERPGVTLLLEVPSSSSYSVEWLGPDGPIWASADKFSMVAVRPGLYSAEVTDLNNGCIGFASGEVVRDSSEVILNRDILFPNVLTSDGNALNAVWRPFLGTDTQRQVFDLFDSFEFKMYNRWGTLLYSGNGENLSGYEWRPSGLADEVCYYHVRFSTLCDPDLDTVEGYVHLVSR